MKEWKVIVGGHGSLRYDTEIHFVANHAKITANGQNLIIDGMKLNSEYEGIFSDLEHAE